jgi:ribonuclease P protein component
MTGVKGDKIIRKTLGTKRKSRSADLTVGLSKINDDQVHFLIIISKKIFKKANKRNALRRRIKAILFVNSKLIYRNANTALVQVQNKKLLYLKHAELQQLILDRFAQIP